MKRLTASAAFFLAAALSVGAVPADVTYTEGDASVRLKNGTQKDAEIGAVLNTGDTLKTGGDGQAELDQKGVTIKIARNTVFTLMEKAQGNQSTSVLSVTLGSIKFHYNKLTGTEPQVRTNGALAGVRGTDFTVFAGADGSTLFTVDSGEVSVEAGGQTVALDAGQGVEVPLGQPPGGTFAVHSDQQDYRTWNADKLAAMLADPLAALGSVETAMADYIKNVGDYAASYQEYRQRLDAERQKRTQIFNEQGADAAQKYEQDVVTPLALQAGYLELNVRFYALAALSLRRFVAGRLYVILKARSIATPTDPTWVSFTSRFDALLASFEKSIAPQLVAVDI